MATNSRWIHEGFGSKAPPLLSDDEFDSSSASESEVSSGSEAGSEDDWPLGLVATVGDRPKARDYDTNGMFRPSSDYYTRSDEDAAVLSVSHMSPLAAGAAAGAAAGDENKENKPAGVLPQIYAPSPHKDPLIQKKNIEHYYKTLLDAYTPSNLAFISKKCTEFSLQSRDEVEVAVNVFYDKGVSGEAHSRHVAFLCKAMECHKIHGIVLFRETMLSCCQKRFLQLKGEITVMEETTMALFTDCKDLTFELQDSETLARYVSWTNLEDRVRYHMSFFGELYNNGELPTKVVLARVSKMLEIRGARHLDLLTIEGLCELFRTSGVRLDSQLNTVATALQSQYQSCFEKFELLAKDASYPARVRDKIGDVVKLKQDEWQDLKKRTSPGPDRETVLRAARAAAPNARVTTTASAKPGGKQEVANAAKAAPVTVKREKAAPPTVRTAKEPLVVQPPSSAEPRSKTEEKLHAQILDNLSKGWRNVMDGREADAVSNYQECVVLFNFLTTPHDQKDTTLVCLYTLLLAQPSHTAQALEKVYQKIKLIRGKSIPFTDYIHLKHLTRTEDDFKKALAHFLRLNKSLEESWSPVYYPLSKQVVAESEQDAVHKELKKFVSTMRCSYKDTFKECVLPSCSTANIYIVDYTDFDNPEMYYVLECSEKCRQYYHHKCFKYLAKWNIDEPCVTPDCSGRIIRLYENRIVKRESKHPEQKKGKEVKATVQPPPSPKGRKKNRKRNDTSNSNKEAAGKEDPAPPTTPPPLSPTPPPPPPPPPPTSTEPEFTGDDIIDMYGTMLIYLEEYPKTHLTNVVMQMNSIYPWIRVGLLNEFLEMGVSSLDLDNAGMLDVRGGTEEAKEGRREEDIHLLIQHYKNSPINSLKQSIDLSAKADCARKKHPSCEKKTTTTVSMTTAVKKTTVPMTTAANTDRVYKRLTKTSGVATSKPEVKHEVRPVTTGYLNPSAPVFSPPEKQKPVEARAGYVPYSVGTPASVGYVPYSTSPHSNPPVSSTQLKLYIPPHLRQTGYHQQGLMMHGPGEVAPHSAPLHGAPLHMHGAPPHVQSGGVPSVGAPIRRPNTDQSSNPEKTALNARVEELEHMMKEMKSSYEKEIDHYKTQLCEQIDSFTKIKAKAKQYKQDYTNAREALTLQTKRQEDFDKLVKQIEDERKNWLNERGTKSVESKKLLLSVRIELEEKNQALDQTKSEIIQKTRENEELSDKSARLESDLFKQAELAMNLKRELIDVTQNFKLTQQQLVQERFTAAKLKLRVAYANCEAQIRERSLQSTPEDYHLSKWRVCQDDIRRKIDDNRFRYDEYVASLHSSQDADMVKFEEEPVCPPAESTVPLLPLQRYDDILLGRPAPPLPALKHNTQLDEEMDVLKSLMSYQTPDQTASFMAPDQTASFMAPDPPSFEASFFASSTPAVVSSAPHFFPSSAPPVASSAPHFEFVSDQIPPSTSSRPPSTGSRPPAGLPPSGLAPSSAHFELSDFMGPPPQGTETRQPGSAPQTRQPGSAPQTRQPGSAPQTRQPGGQSIMPGASVRTPSPRLDYSLPTEQSRPAPRGRGRRGPRTNTTLPISTLPISTLPRTSPTLPPGSTPAPATGGGAAANTQPHRGRELKSKIKANHSFLSEKEISQYLKRVFEESRQKVTSAFVTKRIAELVAMDYPSDDPGTLSSPENTCVICHEALNCRTVSQLGCGHSFHSGCINKWFSTQNHTCPTCRSHQPPVDMFPPLS